MKAKIQAKTQAVADTTIKDVNGVYEAFEAEGWARIALPPIGRDMSITSDFIIMDKAEPLSLYGEYDGVCFEQKEEPVIDQVIRMNTDDSKKKMQMGDISVIKAMRLNSPSINISVDTEYYEDESGTRNILSWQFCFITNDRMLHKVIVFSQCGKLLELNKVLSFLIEYFDLYKPFMKEAGLKFRPLRCWEVPVKDAKGRIKKTVFDNFDEAVEQCSDKVLKQKLIDIGANVKAPYDTSAMYREGVLAHNGYRTGELEDTLKDRLIFVQRVLDRDGKIECIVPVKTPFKQLSAAVNREDFRIKYETKRLSMDFDLKRKPVKKSLYTEKVTINGVEYELACFETVPYKDVEEYLLYKKVGRNSTVLKTVPQWQAFFERVNRAASGEKSVTIRDYEKRRLQSCVMAIVQGVEIKALGGKANVPILLDKDVSVSKKLNFINQINNSSTVFSNEDWRNCRRKDRLYQLLPESEFIDLLRKIISADVEK